MTRALPTNTSTPSSRAPELPKTKYITRGAGRPKQVAEVRARGIDTANYRDADKVDVNKPLTEKQRRLVQLFASGETIANAAERAGYENAPTYGYRLMKQPNARALYDVEKKKYEESCHMTRARVMEGLLDAVAMAKLAGEPASMVAGWREIGKMCGYYEPIARKVEVTINGSVALERMNRLSDAELLKLIHDDLARSEGDDE